MLYKNSLDEIFVTFEHSFRFVENDERNYLLIKKIHYYLQRGRHKYKIYKPLLKMHNYSDDINDTNSSNEWFRSTFDILSLRKNNTAIYFVRGK